MAKFAIVRADGTVDTADGMSVQDVADRYGWPGDGTIETYDPNKHTKPANDFTTPADQRAAWEKIAKKEKQSGVAADDTDATEDHE